MGFVPKASRWSLVARTICRAEVRMQRKRQVELLERILDLIDRQSTDMAPSTSRQDVDAYLDPERFQGELQAVFARSPLLVGGASELAERGAYFTHTQAGLRAAVVRGASGELSAFVDTCLHRGTRLLGERTGTLKNSIVCPYHGWNYALDGRLLHVPHALGFPDVCGNARRLKALSVASGH